MSESGAVFESLYTRLVLRDLFAKVAPGALLLVTARVTLTSLPQTVAEMNAAHLGAWFVFGAVAWLAGLAIQGIGELTGLVPCLPIRYFPEDVSPDDFRKALVRFDAKNAATADDRQRVERLVVIKEAAGVGCLALVLSLLLVVIVRWNDLARLWPGVLLAAAAVAGLAKLHYDSAKRQHEHIAAVLKRGDAAKG